MFISKVTVRLVGGIGNQLFGYYAAAAVAYERNWELILDASWTHRRLTGHDSSILNLDLPGKWHWSKDNSWSRFPYVHKSKIVLDRFTMRSPSLKKLRKVRDFSGEIGWNPEVLLVEPRQKIWGHFQSWKFVDLALSQGLPRRPHLKAHSSTLDRLIDLSQAVRPISVHVRRGDYQLKQNRNFGVLSSAYYQEAIQKLRENGHSGPVWIFTDSPSEAKSFLDGHLVSGDLTPTEELFLMSHCDAHVIANSTFSWWGAWMNPNNPHVIAPRPWFIQGPEIPDLLPENWWTIAHK